MKKLKNLAVGSLVALSTASINSAEAQVYATDLRVNGQSVDNVEVVMTDSVADFEQRVQTILDKKIDTYKKYFTEPENYKVDWGYFSVPTHMVNDKEHMTPARAHHRYMEVDSFYCKKFSDKRLKFVIGHEIGHTLDAENPTIVSADSIKFGGDNFVYQFWGLNVYLKNEVTGEIKKLNYLEEAAADVLATFFAKTDGFDIYHQPNNSYYAVNLFLFECVKQKILSFEEIQLAIQNNDPKSLVTRIYGDDPNDDNLANFRLFMFFRDLEEVWFQKKDPMDLFRLVEWHRMINKKERAEKGNKKNPQ